MTMNSGGACLLFVVTVKVTLLFPLAISRRQYLKLRPSWPQLSHLKMPPWRHAGQNNDSEATAVKDGVRPCETAGCSGRRETL